MKGCRYEPLKRLDENDNSSFPKSDFPANLTVHLDI